MRNIFLSLLAITFLLSCATYQPTSQPVVQLTIDGNVVEVIDGTNKHPCEGNWNFCDQVMKQEKLIIPGEYDEYGSYMYPEF